MGLWCGMNQVNVCSKGIISELVGYAVNLFVPEDIPRTQSEFNGSLLTTVMTSTLIIQP